MRITEIFLSVQGESSWTGLPCVFVRTTGCHLRCVWCDTDYAFYGGREMSVDEIVSQVEDLGRGCKLVEITGGEPLLQKDVGALASQLLERGHTVLCETSGSLDIDLLPADVIKIIDVKCPGSGEADKNLWENLDKLSADDEIKFVIDDRADYEWAMKTIEEKRLAGKKLLFAPVWDAVSPQQLAEWILDDNAPVRLQTQLHKIIWSPHTPGV